MKGFLKNNLSIFSLYFLALVYAALMLLNNDKIFIHIYLNQFVGNPFFDTFFYYMTYLGDGMVAPFLLLIILIYNIRLGVYATISFLTATLSAQVLKRFFFDDFNRPSYIFNYMFPYPIKYIDGVERYIHNSFPSGHATQAFSILMCLAFVTKNQSLKLLFFFLALFTSMSRV
ncbi:MAG TPA: phosphatase PAP2 family protein, partial [Bacteroidia bacterium]|nr:phosphatase PAP2 family protein [Bacteroidia bacterium]